MDAPLLVTLATRNLARNLRRTLITGVTVTFGVAVSVAGWGLVEGLDENVLRAARTTQTGDLLLRPHGYPTDGMDWPLAEAKVPDTAVIARLDAAGTWAPRTYSMVRLVKGADAARVLAVAWDPARDGTVFPRERWTIEGSWGGSTAEGTAGLVLGTGLARLLGVKVDDNVILEGRTREGALNALPFRVTGVVRTDNGAMDNMGAWVRMDDAEALLLLGGARTHVAVKLRDDQDAAALAREVTALGWDAHTTREEVADVLALNDLRRKALVLLVGVVMAIAGTGIANTVVMSVYVRVREIGTLLAMGLRRAQVRALFLMEGAVLGTAAGLLGAALGAALVVHFQTSGIDLGPELAQAGGNTPMSAVLYTRFTWPPLLGSLAFGVLMAVGASLWPAHHAAGLHPADATRAD